MIYCSNCGTANRDGSRFCNECGFRLGALLPCPFCHLPNLSTSRFCNFCGRRLMAGQPLSIEQQLESCTGLGVTGGIPPRVESAEAEEKPSGGLGETEAGEIGVAGGWTCGTESAEAMSAAVEIVELPVSEAESPEVAAAEGVATGEAIEAGMEEPLGAVPRVGATEAASPGVELVEGEGAIGEMTEAVSAEAETAQPSSRELDTVGAAVAETETAPVAAPAIEPERITASGTEVVQTEVGVAETQLAQIEVGVAQTEVAEATGAEAEAAGAVCTVAEIGVPQLEVAHVGVSETEVREIEVAETEVAETEVTETEVAETRVAEVDIAEAVVAEAGEAEVGEIEALEPEVEETLPAELTALQAGAPEGNDGGIVAEEVTIDQTQAIEGPRAGGVAEPKVAPDSTISVWSMRPEPPAEVPVPEMGLGKEAQEAAFSAGVSAGSMTDGREPGLITGEPGFGIGIEQVTQPTDAVGGVEVSLGTEAVSEDEREPVGWIDRGEGQAEELPEWLDTLSTRPVITVAEPAPQQQLVGAIVVAQSVAKPPRGQRQDDGGEQYERAAEMLANVIRTSPTIVDAERFRRTVKRGWFGR